MNASSNEEPCMTTDPCIFTAHKLLQGKKVTTLHAFYAACLPCGNTKFPGYFYSLSSKHSRTAFPEEWTPKGRKGQLLVGRSQLTSPAGPGSRTSLLYQHSLAACSEANHITEAFSESIHLINHPCLVPVFSSRIKPDLD